MALRTIDSLRSRLGSGSWWFRSSDGRLVVGQYPNPALWVWIVATLVGWTDLSTDHASTVDGIRAGALIVWALDEAVRGASPFRHLLGAVVLAAQLSSLLIT
jgi:hypothetical protein